jgi:hypothetical protein
LEGRKTLVVEIFLKIKEYTADKRDKPQIIA